MAQNQAASGKSELHYLTVSQAARLIKQRKLSPVEYTQAILRRIEAVEPKVHAFITVAADHALDAAKRAEKEIIAGKYRRPVLPSGRETVKQNFARPWNVCGYPALIVPAGFSTEPAGLPVSLQLCGRPFEEELLYAAGSAYESETKWWEKRQPAL